MSQLTVTYQDIGVIVAELTLILLGFIILNSLVNLIFTRLLETLPRLEKYSSQVAQFRRTTKGLILLVFVVAGLAVLVFNGYLIYIHEGVLPYTLTMLSTIPADFWQRLSLGVGMIIVLSLVARFLVRQLERLIRFLEKRAKAYEQIKANTESIAIFFNTLNHIQKNGIWLFVIAQSARISPLPESVANFLFLILTIYLIIAVGRLLATAVSAVTDSVDALAERYSKDTSFETFYQRLQGLLGLWKRVLEYVIYVLTATLVVGQIDFISHLAIYGPTLIQVIGIVFLGRVVIEVGNVLLDQLVKSRPDHLTDVQWQQRLTLTPLGKSFLLYVIYFGAALLILRTFNVNITPILAAMGGLGLILGLGAQSVINDLVSGIFILFENIYLVGDYIETGEASGVVEAIDIRTTRLRDPDGQVYILRNGQLGDIVNFSKGFIFTVVEVKVGFDADLDHVYQVIEETGRHLKEINEDVLDVTQVEGVSKFGQSEILIHTNTKAKPGRHREVGFQLRKLLKEAFEREGIIIPYPQQIISLRENGRFGVIGPMNETAIENNSANPS